MQHHVEHSTLVGFVFSPLRRESKLDVLTDTVSIYRIQISPNNIRHCSVRIVVLDVNLSEETDQSSWCLNCNYNVYVVYVMNCGPRCNYENKL